MATAIVIVTRNNFEFLSRCIETVKDYTQLAEYRFIVVDNGSTDRTMDYLRKLGCRVVSNADNVGFGAAVNQGLAYLEPGEDVLLLNDDTQITDRHWLHRLDMNLTGEVGAVGPVSNYVAGVQDIKWSSELPLQHETNTLIGFCMLISHDALRAVGTLDERFGWNMFEDIDYSIRLQQAGYKLMVDRTVFVWHYGSQSFKKEADQFNKRLRTGEQMLVNKWGPELWDQKKILPPSLMAWIKEQRERATAP